ncbi:MAG: membrane or secreted protein [Flavobacteriales bacterium]
MKEVTMIKLIFISIALLMIAFAGIAIKIWAKKDGAFSGTCASNNPMLQEEGASCGLCGATPEEKCKN